MSRTPSRYSDPYLAGVGIGLVLLAAYLVAGRGLGASGAFSTVVAASTVAVVGADAAATSAAVVPYLGTGAAPGSALTVNPFADWLVVELIGVIIGGFCSAWLAGRLSTKVETGQHLAARPRLLAALGGGMLMGFGARLARGCTSGQALSGGALLSTGSWIFIATCFAAGYALAPAARRLWR
jgi:uncharacterized membrane protein YedE/YeeE